MGHEDGILEVTVNADGISHDCLLHKSQSSIEGIGP
jgi:hypothetical protein